MKIDSKLESLRQKARQERSDAVASPQAPQSLLEKVAEAAPETPEAIPTEVQKKRFLKVSRMSSAVVPLLKKGLPGAGAILLAQLECVTQNSTFCMALPLTMSVGLD